MGAEAKCALTMGRTKAVGKALLEGDSLIFRGGDARLAIRFKDMSSVTAKDGAIRVMWSDGVATFAVGDVAEKWADRIRNPRSRADKLGIKAAQRVLFVDIDDMAFRSELESRGAVVMQRAAGDLDAIFYAVDHRRSLARLRSLKEQLKADGALWTIRPKAAPDITEADVMKAGKAAGLVDVKVVRFSESHTAEKFVVPRSKRPRGL